MPYVPSKKTDGVSTDREVIDAKVEVLAAHMVEQINSNIDICSVYTETFKKVAEVLLNLEVLDSPKVYEANPVTMFATTIAIVGREYEYEGAFLGELNYAITRLIQEVPAQLVKAGKQEKELRYFIYAYTVEALIKTAAADFLKETASGIAGVFEDIKDEYKRRVNTSYEAAQIVKSGDCYTAPYRTRLVKVVDSETKKFVGYQEVMVDENTDVDTDILGVMDVSVQPMDS